MRLQTWKFVEQFRDPAHKYPNYLDFRQQIAKLRQLRYTRAILGFGQSIAATDFPVCTQLKAISLNVQ